MTIDATEVAQALPYWPPWSEQESGFAKLAAYVSTESLRGHGLLPDGPRPALDGPAGEDAGAAIEREAAIDREAAAELFDRLVARRIGYQEEPWRAGTEMQGIRHADWLLSEGGNCLDFCATYAAMCLERRVAPMLALTATHALVLIRPGWLSTGRQVDESFELAGTAEIDSGALAVLDPDPLLAAARAGELVAVDPTVAREKGARFEEAAATATAILPEVTSIVDVAYLLESEEITPFATPTGWPGIRRYPASGFGHAGLLEAQGKVAAELQGASGLHAIVADPGQGKSTVARHVCGKALGRAAWFLNAADPKAFEDSLAAAVLNEQGKTLADLGRADREGFAYAALDRLRRATTPWVVVLDNANGTYASLGRFVPRPSHPGQLVLVTTTNETWAADPEVTAHPLGAASEAEVESRLGSDLAEVAGGSPLLIDAFSRLCRATGRSPGEVAAELEAAEEYLDGAPAYWYVLSNLKPFGDPEVRLAARAALLPPDRLSAGLLDAVAAAPPGTFAELAALGLFELGEGAEESSLHRLFGTAIRDRPLPPGHQPSAAGIGFWEDAALDLLADPAALALLGRFGDRESVERLLKLVEALDDTAPPSPGSRLARALHGAALLLEERGSTGPSGDAYARLERHLDDADSGDRRLRAEFLHVRARTAYRDPGAKEARLREGLAFAREAHAIAAEIDGYERAGKFLAMQGLLLKQLASYPRPGENEAGLLHDALDVLDKAHELRAALLGHDDPEFARSLFNLAGIRIPLAKAERSQAAVHLAEGARIYREVIEIRGDIYGVPVHPHIAICVQGLGLVGFYRAVLGDETPEGWSKQLREATVQMTEALRQWEAIEGDRDGAEVSKASKILAKIAVARHAYPLIWRGHGSIWSHVAALEVELAQDFAAP